jgi:NADPH2:quinone reductase
MRAIQIQSHGGPDKLKLVSLPDPTPGVGEVLVRIKASAINPLDAIVREGHFPIAKKPPLILGEEAAGLVERGSNGFSPGDRVLVYGGGLGVFRDGTWAELVAVPAGCLRNLPEDISFEEGAALPNAGVTAYGALRAADLKAGEALIVLGASGGVGSAGVQIGKAMGAHVIAVVTSAEKAERIRPLGADEILTFRANLTQQVQNQTGGNGANVVLDPIGGEATGRALAALGPSGRLLHLGYSAGTTLTINSLDLIAKATRIIGFNIFLLPPDRSAKDFDEVIALVEQKKYRPVLDKVYPVHDVVAATEHLEGRVGVGKVVLQFG